MFWEREVAWAIRHLLFAGQQKVVVFPTPTMTVDKMVWRFIATLRARKGRETLDRLQLPQEGLSRALELRGESSKNGTRLVTQCEYARARTRAAQSRAGASRRASSERGQPVRAARRRRVA
eukprot:scaffold74374_cov32-Tisochrysis_lutea.AAC.3